MIPQDFKHIDYTPYTAALEWVILSHKPTHLIKLKSSHVRPYWSAYRANLPLCKWSMLVTVWYLKTSPCTPRLAQYVSLYKLSVQVHMLPQYPRQLKTEQVTSICKFELKPAHMLTWACTSCLNMSTCQPHSWSHMRGGEFAVAP